MEVQAAVLLAQEQEERELLDKEVLVEVACFPHLITVREVAVVQVQ
jgi:hypothetical protein